MPVPHKARVCPRSKHPVSLRTTAGAENRGLGLNHPGAPSSSTWAISRNVCALWVWECVCPRETRTLFFLPAAACLTFAAFRVAPERHTLVSRPVSDSCPSAGGLGL